MRRGLVALVALVALSACGGTSGGSAAAPHPSGEPCVEASPPPSGPASSGPASSGPALADLTLACLTGGGEVRLAHLGRPVLINLWASWCGPCRQELPAFQRYAQRAAGAVLVVGVATDTGRTAGRSVVDDLGLTFPMLYDRDRTLLLAAGRANLPVTLFVDAHGRVAYVYNSTALDDAAIASLAAEHLGVVAG
jgi:thiol-disulfide isomerase/thioredoxin